MKWKPEKNVKIVLKIDQRLSAIDVDPKILGEDNESGNANRKTQTLVLRMS